MNRNAASVYAAVINKSVEHSVATTIVVAGDDREGDLDRSRHHHRAHRANRTMKRRIQGKAQLVAGGIDAHVAAVDAEVGEVGISVELEIIQVELGFEFRVSGSGGEEGEYGEEFHKISLKS